MDAFNLLDETYTTVKVLYLSNEYQSTGKKYSYKVPRAWRVCKGDTLVVPSRDAYALVVVADVDEEPDFNGSPSLRYAVQKVDMTEYLALIEREGAFRAALLKVERQKKKDEVLKDLQHMADGSEAASVLLGEAIKAIS